MPRELDEDDVRVRPSRSTRPRTKTRPGHLDSSEGLVVTVDRGPVLHVDVHACYPDGRYVLVDVVGDDLVASVRADGWENPPCRPAP